MKVLQTRKFSWSLIWDEGHRVGAEAGTWGRLSVWVGEDLLWGTVASEATGIHWTWVDLLEHLAEVWPWLQCEEGWPGGASFASPSTFWSSTTDWLQSLAPERAAVEEDRLFEFRHRHDLASAIQGKLLPPLWIVREGKQIWVAGHSQSACMQFDSVREELERLGDTIVARLQPFDDERSACARKAWHERMDLDAGQLSAIAVGVDRKELEALVEGDIVSAFELSDLGEIPRFEPNELLAAARMAVAVTDPSAVRAILCAIRAIPARPSDALDGISYSARVFLESASPAIGHAAQAGYVLAEWLRIQLRIQKNERAEPARVLETLGVEIKEIAVDDDAIDAVACWGPHHGPAVLLNSLGNHNKEEQGRRATLAHELAHLLVDRQAGLPLAEVLGGKVSAPVEQRARAFAAEFLLPRKVAGAAFQTTTRDVEEATRLAVHALHNLAAAYGVSREIVAWQTYRSGLQMAWPTFKLLRDEVTYPDRFRWDVAQRGAPS